MTGIFQCVDPYCQRDTAGYCRKCHSWRSADMQVGFAAFGPASDGMGTQVVNVAALQVEVERLRALLREALCRGQLPDGLPERIRAALAKEEQ